MGAKTAIEWTDSSWNPLRGCSHVSAGCDNCYAERVARRFYGHGEPFEGVARGSGWTGDVRLVEKRLLDPMKWRPVVVPCPTCGSKRRDCDCDEINVERGATTRPRRIFVGSMSDLFHENVTDEMRDQIFAVMALCPQHVFQVLTKRPERMLSYLGASSILRTDRIVKMVGLRFPIGTEAKLQPICWPLPNVWLGVSVENRAAANERIPLLLQTPAAKRFVSCEPLLSKLTFRWARWDDHAPNLRRVKQLPPVERGGKILAGCVDHLDGLRMLDWVICGGESGPHARPMHPNWARSLRDQCAAAQVPFFLKQWGEWAPTDFSVANGGHVSGDGAMARVGKKSAGALLDGQEYKSFPVSER